jgi:thiol:disulfide interchange protein/DsbC/DsbD-like thiol-disulfide interchange protein
MQRLTLAAVLLGVSLALAGAWAGAAAPVRTAHVEAELVAEQTALVPGRPLTVALRLAMERGWHTYWQNPGDSGLPTTLAWQLPPGLTAGPIQWPAPRALPTGPLMNYGYEGEVLLLADIAAAPDFLSGRTISLAARADWLVCKEICIPEGADLTLTLPVANSAEPDPRWAEPIAARRAALPQALSGWRAVATGTGPKVVLTLTGEPGAADPGELWFFPFVAGAIEPSAKQTLVRGGDAWELTLPVASQRVGEFTRVAGVLTASNGFGGRRAATIDVPLAGSVVGSPSSPPAAVLPLAPSGGASDLSFGLALAFALIGGVLLNLMPCVFPVLSLKVLGFAMHGGGRRAMRAHGLAFAAGVIASFWLLAAALMALRAAGQQLGWGFQLQSPAVIAALALLFFVLALNLSGVFEIGQLVPSRLAGWNAKNPYLNDALSGVLAVVVASPCSAPLMGVALGYALIAAPLVTWSVFTTLAVGMALPYLLLAFFPGWRARLPKPGPWMQRLRQLLAFPLYASVLWLAWVLGAQLDNDAVLRLGAALLLVALALWAWQTRRTGGLRGWGFAALASIVIALGVAWPLVAATTPPAAARSAASEPGPWQDYAPDRVARWVGAGRPVFVDFTAAWCVTCQVNKRLVLNSSEVQHAFMRGGVVLLRADWTRRDAMIGAALAALGRSGVPVYVLYRPGREPLVLPEVLQRSTITDALATL